MNLIKGKVSLDMGQPKIYAGNTRVPPQTPFKIVYRLLVFLVVPHPHLVFVLVDPLCDRSTVGMDYVNLPELVHKMVLIFPKSACEYGPELECCIAVIFFK